MRALALATALVGLDRDRGRRVRRADRPPDQVGRDAPAAPYGDQRRADRPAEPGRLPDRASGTGSTPRASAGTQIGLCAIDLNRFKEINDVHGHKAGDERARPARRADARSDRARRHGRPARRRRIRGDHDASRIMAELTAFADRLDAALKTPLTFGHFERPGRRQHRRRGLSARRRRCRDARQQCRSRHVPGQERRARSAPCYYDSELDEAIRERRELANDLRQAIERERARDALSAAGLGRDARDHRL